MRIALQTCHQLMYVMMERSNFFWICNLIKHLDQIRLLKEIAFSIAPVLTLLFQASFDQPCLFTRWLEKQLNNVCPIFKKNDRSNPSNYWPVSLTCVCCKLPEHIIYSNIINHLYPTTFRYMNNMVSTVEGPVKLN